MMRVRGGAVTLSGRDLKEWNAAVLRDPTGDLGAFARTFDRRAMRGREGAMLTQGAPLVNPRPIQIPIAIEADTHSQLVARMESLQHFAERGPHRLIFGHTPTRYWRVRLEGDAVIPTRPRFTSTLAKGLLSFVSDHAVSYDLEPFRLAVVDNTERVPIPVGTGDVAPLFKVAGGNLMTIVYRNARGTVVASMTLNTDLSATPNDYLLVDNQEEAVWRVSAGVVTPADALLQGSYITCSARYGDLEANAPATLEVTSGRMEVIGRLTHRR